MMYIFSHLLFLSDLSSGYGLVWGFTGRMALNETPCTRRHKDLEPRCWKTIQDSDQKKLACIQQEFINTTTLLYLYYHGMKCYPYKEGRY